MPPPWPFDAVVVAEPTRGEAVLAHRGISSVRMRFAGRAGHASGSQQTNDSALHQALRWGARALDHAESLAHARFGGLTGLRFNIGKVEGGMVRLGSHLVDGRLRLLVEDDGAGIPEAKLATLFEQGIGVSNVNERLKVLYDGDYRMWIDSKPGEGTRTEIDLPGVAAPVAAAS